LAPRRERLRSRPIARSSWDIDIWPADSYTKEAVPRDDADYKKRHAKVAAGDYFDIPYGCIVAAGVDNLLMAGQCLSASHVAESSLRIQQTCMATGQAAGIALLVAAATVLLAGCAQLDDTSFGFWDLLWGMVVFFFWVDNDILLYRN
jgi:hypothetical protein